MNDQEMEKFPACFREQQPADACQYSDQTSCDADALCTWCKCAAVPSACYTVVNAKKLPPSVFACDKL